MGSVRLDGIPSNEEWCLCDLFARDSRVGIACCFGSLLAIAVCLCLCSGSEGFGKGLFGDAFGGGLVFGGVGALEVLAVNVFEDVEGFGFAFLEGADDGFKGEEAVGDRCHCGR